jgi:MYXO-CTERM domain-containing protein
MKHQYTLAVAAAFFACSSSPESIDRKSQAATFPADSEWIPLRQAGATIGDVITDGNNNGRELVGDATFAAVSVYSDGTDFFVRLRLDDDPTGSGQAVVAPFGWGILIDTNNNLDDYEFIIIIDGTGPDEIALAQNTNQQTVGDPNDVAEVDVFVTPADGGVDGNVSITTADSTFGGDADFFLDFALPMSALNGVGLDLTDTVRFVAGTSNNGRSLSVDLMSCDDGATTCTLTTSSSDTVMLDGSNADLDSDGVLSPADLDDDNDGVLDSDENDLGVDPDGDADTDGVPNWRDADDEGDGSSTCLDGDANGVCDAAGARFDADGDGVPNHLDVDSDNDGIVDLVEAGHGATDAAGDGLVDGAVGTNGFVDALETGVDTGVATYLLHDTDGDGIEDRLDLDSDGDGVSDLDEIGGAAPDLDVDGDGRVDSSVDADGDGLMASVDGDEARFGVPGIDVSTFDTDVDGIPSPYDAADAGPTSGDSDGDGDDDTTECAGTWPACADTDSDGQPDYMRSSLCGNGTLNAGEGCDDGDTDDGDGCSAICQVEDGSACNASAPGDIGDASCASGNCDLLGNAAPGVCEALGVCGNGLLEAGEGCDDGNTATGDGCTDVCQVEDGGACNDSAPGELGDASCDSGNCDTVGNPAPGVCEALGTCGNGILETGEGCDDGNTTDADGCSVICFIEDGGACNTTAPGIVDDASCDSGICDTVGNPAPGVCEGVNTCGNGLLEAGEGCDDGNATGADGCSATCEVEDGGACNASAPGDIGSASCESGNCDLAGNPAPGICEALGACGNGLIEAGEGCDDGNTTGADGCSATCEAENGTACNDTAPGDIGDASCQSGNCDLLGNAAPGICEGLGVCGNGLLEAGEGCDDGNTAGGDGCTGICLNQAGTACNQSAPGLVGDASCADGTCNIDGGLPGVCENTSDTDGDGVLDVVDLDDDNDGILDSEEGDAALDTDADGIPDSLDLDSDNDGALDLIEAGSGATDADEDGLVDCAAGFGSNGFCDSLETSADSGIADYDGNGVGDSPSDEDSDGLPDFQDLDSDNDGLSDLLEVDSGCTDTTPTDQRCDDIDADGDGIVDELDDQAGFGDGGYSLPPNTDESGLEDYRDTDSDNDGLADLIEGASLCAATSAEDRCDGPDADGDGIADDAGTAGIPDTDGDGHRDYRDRDADDDGLQDNVEGLDDTDGDGLPNALDLDSDDDGISDLVEGRSGCADGDGDSRCDGPDSDNDGVADDAAALVSLDTEGDGVDDYLDLDSDDDGLSDLVEGGSSCVDASPANAVCDGPDSNGDGLVDDAAGGSQDSDGDGADDYVDLDSDNDGLSDLVEGGSGCTEDNGDQLCDGPDGDGDGIVDSIDDTVGHGDDPTTVPANQDGDGLPDFLDLDSDGDGTNDAIDSGCDDLAPNDGICDGDDSDGDGIVDGEDDSDDFGLGDDTDTDGDGVPDTEDLDDDGDGLMDADEGDGLVDTDRDRIPDTLDLDSDDDGILDEREAGHDYFTGSGIARCNSGVGLNGFCDLLETSPDSGIPDYAGDGPLNEVRDTDRDQVPDFRDLDSDNDTIVDSVESGSYCVDVEPALSACDGGDTDRDGVVNQLDQSIEYGAGNVSNPIDTDDDGIADFRDLDADNDTIPDIVEAGYGVIDDDDDGTADRDDYDGDGLVDTIDESNIFGGGPPGVDTDGDGRPDHRDVDADGDGVPDEEEAGENPHEPADSDDDGSPDFQDLDSDNDGIEDEIDNCRVDENVDQQDLDQNGRGSVCQEGQEVGIQGGGCTTSGTSTSTGLSLLLVVFGLALLRRRRHGVAVALLFFASLWSAGADAQGLDIGTDYPVERLRLSSDAEGILDVEWAAVTSHKAISLGLWLGYADDPLNLYKREDGERERAGSLVSSRMAGSLVGSVGLYDRLQLGMEVPLILYQGQDLDGLMNASPTSFGLGDLRLVPKMTLMSQHEVGLHVGLSIGFTLPTSTSDDYFGDKAATFTPEVLVARSFNNGLRLGANVGMVSRKRTQIIDLVVDDELTARVGAGYRLSANGGPPLELDVTYAMATSMSEVGDVFNRNYGEVKFGGAYDIRGPLILFAASGIGVAEGFGTPDWRALAGVRFRPEADDEPIDMPEPVLVDTDHDGIYDYQDKCPTFPETPNDFEDEDGCPDQVPDSDRDGLNDLVDTCPHAAEDIDGFQDDDGCPDTDNDGDGFADFSDACPDEVGIEEMGGCPDPDRDGDTVVDRLDNCPDEPGKPEFQGCNKKQLVTLTGNTIEILDVVYFRVNKDVILSRSFALLDNVAAVLRDHTELDLIRVEGHTDSQGKDSYNKALSQRRAEAVRAYLIKGGVASDRLEAVGMGEAHPIDDNKTKQGRAANRRVEFKIVGDHAPTVEVKSSGPTEETIEK